MKNCWLSAVDGTQETVQELVSRMKPYGLAMNGHFWKDDLKNMAWTGVAEGVRHPDTAYWAILASAKSLESPDTRYGLCMAALSVRSVRGAAYPIIIVQSGDEAIVPARLPTPLADAKCLLASDKGLPAKLVAAAHTPVKGEMAPYHVGIHADPQVGQWFEIRPCMESWSGMLFGVSEGRILFQAVGDAGGLPEKSVLNYPVQGLELTLGERAYTAWAVENELNDRTAYYVKVEDHPASILFGPYTREDSAEMYVLSLK